MGIGQGNVVTTNAAFLKNIEECDEIWLITRAGPDIPNTIRVRELAPSQHLFNKFISQWRGKDPDEWWPKYVECFKKELETKEKLFALRRLWKLVKSGRKIALVCFCKDDRYCHRTLVGDFLKTKGIQVEEKCKKECNAPFEFQQLSMF